MRDLGHFLFCVAFLFWPVSLAIIIAALIGLGAAIGRAF